MKSGVCCKHSSHCCFAGGGGGREHFSSFFSFFFRERFGWFLLNGLQECRGFKQLLGKNQV